MQTGVVKWFNNAKGYGFILSDIEKLEVFAHYSVIEMDGYKSLKAGQCVAFEVSKSSKGVQASRIRILNDVDLTKKEQKQVVQKEVEVDNAILI